MADDRAMLGVRDGWIVCPVCRKRILRVAPETAARALPVWCRRCRREFRIDIDRGQSARRQSP